MIAHDAVSMDDPTGPLACIEETIFKRELSSLVFKNPGSVVPSVEHMVKGSLVGKS